MPYEIRMSDQVVNTGVDGEVFPDRQQAEQAAEVINGEYPEAGAEVYPTDSPPTITFAAWHAAPWGA